MFSTSAGRIAGNLSTVLFAAIIVLQLLLAIGLLPVTMAWGGRQETLTPALRAAHVFAAGILAAFAYVIRRRAGLTNQESTSRMVRIAAGAVPAFLLLNTLGNLASKSTAERVVFGPTSLALAVACFVVSASRSER